MNTALNNTTFGNLGPRAIFTTPAVWSLYQISQTGNIRYYNTELADAGFRHLEFSTLPILFDSNISTGLMFFLDTENLWLQVLRQGNMVTTKFIESANQLSEIAKLYLFGNLTMGSRRTQSRIRGITS